MRNFFNFIKTSSKLQALLSRTSKCPYQQFYVFWLYVIWLYAIWLYSYMVLCVMPFFSLSTHLLKARPSGPGYSGKTNLESEIGNRENRENSGKTNRESEIRNRENRENSGKVNLEASKFSSELSEAAMTARQTRMQRVAFMTSAEFLKN